MNYGFLTTETNSNALYIFHGFHHLISKAIFKEYPSSYGSSLVTVNKACHLQLQPENLKIHYV